MKQIISPQISQRKKFAFVRKTGGFGTTSKVSFTSEQILKASLTVAYRVVSWFLSRWSFSGDKHPNNPTFLSGAHRIGLTLRHVFAQNHALRQIVSRLSRGISRAACSAPVFNVGEPDLFQTLNNHLGRAEKTVCRVSGPRQWIIRFSGRSSSQMAERVLTTRNKHAIGLSEHSGFIPDIHGDVLTPHKIKALIFLVNIGDASLVDGNPVINAAKFVQTRRRFDIFQREVNRLDLTTKCVGEISALAANATSGIKNPSVFPNFNHSGLGDCRIKATPMQLIHQI